MYKRITIFVLLLLIPWISVNGSGAESAGFFFLNNEMGARPTAMGGGCVALSGDIHGLLKNPASLIGLEDWETTFSYQDHLLDFQTGFIGTTKHFRSIGQLGLGIGYINYGEFKERDIFGEEMGSFVPFDFLLVVSRAAPISMKMFWGGSLKYIQSRIHNYTSNAVALDLGAIYRLPDVNWDFGLSIMNLGYVFKSYIDVREKLPIQYRCGVAKRLAHLPLKVHIDLIRYHYDESDLFLGLYWVIGGEFTLSEKIRLRWGYNSKGQEQGIHIGQDRLAGISIGLGITILKYQFDIGYNSYGALGSINSFSLSTVF